MNWISADESFQCETRHYDQLFTVERPNEYPNYTDYLNKDSLQVYKNSRVHKDLLKEVKVMDRLQFERKGFFVVDKDSRVEEGLLIWNKTVGLHQDKDKPKK